MWLFNWLKNLRKPKTREIKLGLALGSGGAKGFAELGAIKAFEENGIEFDYIAGTSIGSIVGAFYANGYSSTDILEMISSINVSEIKNFLMLGMDTSGLYNVIDRALGSLNIEDLKKPFRAVATDIDEGKEKVFESGNTAKALCASSCMPPFFKPVIIDNKRYCDGAFMNSVPADIVKELGADYIVGIDLKNHEAQPNLLERIFPTYKGGVKEPWEKGYKFSNIVLKPDLTNYTATSFKDKNEMYEIGYKCALEQIQKIKSEIEELKIIKPSKGKKDKDKRSNKEEQDKLR